MDGDDRVNVRQQRVIKQVGIGHHLQHLRIGWGEPAQGPGFQLLIGNALRAENDLSLSVEPHRHEVTLMDIQTNKESRNGSHHTTSVGRKESWVR